MRLSWPRERRPNVPAALFAVATVTLLVALCDTADALAIERKKAPVSWNYTPTCPLPPNATLVGVDTFDRVEPVASVVDVDNDGVVRERGVVRAEPRWWTTLPPGGVR